MPALPVDRQFRYAAGIQCDSSKDVAIGVSHTLIDAGTCKIDETGKPVTGDLVRKYDPNLINVFNVNFVHRFWDRPPDDTGRVRGEPGVCRSE